MKPPSLEAFVRLMIRHGSVSDEINFDHLFQHNRWTGSPDAIRDEFLTQEGKLIVRAAPEDIDE